MTEVLLKKQIDGKTGSVVILTLNQPNQLNALSMGMIRSINAELDRAENEHRIKCLFITGAGDKAFCAGGDIKEMYEQLKSGSYELSDRFFSEEYALDYRLSTFPKPVIALVNGIVMGGGVGVMQGCRYRAVTEKTRFAMPETQIGLYPDVSAGFFLNKIPKYFGIFMGLTGVNINAGDLLAVGLADRLIPLELLREIPAKIAGLDWKDTPAENHRQVYRFLKDHDKPELAPDSLLEKHRNIITDAVDSMELTEIFGNIQGLPDTDQFLAAAQNNIGYASPFSLAVTFELLSRFKTLSLKDVLEKERILSLNFLRHGEFCEGVRALLIDRDRQPNWRYKKLELIPAVAVAAIFEENYSVQDFNSPG